MVHTKIIEPNDLDTLATSPQCIDNQFIPEKLFNKMTLGDKKKSLKEVIDRILIEYGGDSYSGSRDADANLLLRTQRNEYNRSLIYARQIVINRAMFWNSAPLVVSELSEDVDPLAELIKQEVITPYLYTERNLEDPPKNFDLILGEKAMKRLINALGSNEIKCVRFSSDEKENEIQTKNLSTRFHTEFTKLSEYKGDLVVDRIVELLTAEDTSKEFSQ
jgi:hypothetical protein